MKQFSSVALLALCLVDNSLARPMFNAWSETSNSFTRPTGASNFLQTQFEGDSSSTTTTSSSSTSTSTTTTTTTIPVTQPWWNTSTSTTSSTTVWYLNTTTSISTSSSLANTAIPTGWPSPATITTTSTTTTSAFGNTTSTAAPSALPVPPTNGTGVLQFALVNNMAGEAVYAYVTGTDENNNLVILQPNGQWYTPSVGGSQVPVSVDVDISIPLGAQGSTTYISMPSYISAGRVWFAEGKLKFSAVTSGTGSTALVEPSATDPSDSNANINWGFVELTYTKAAGLWANISYVDFVGMVLGMVLQTQDGKTQATPGLQPGAVKAICAALTNQTSVDGHAWNELCVNDSRGEPLRVLSPGNYMQLHSDAFSDYWQDYVERVWAQYRTQPLTINTQSTAGHVSCTVQGNDKMMCDGDSTGFDKPTPEDIFGCNSGPFAIATSDSDVRRAAVPRLCAAFNRSTLLLAGGNVQPSLSESQYYAGDEATNHYSKIVHQYEDDGTGYAFSYDDVTPDNGTPQSGELVSPIPQLLTITVGGAKI